MATTQYRSGDVTINLTGDLERYMRDLVTKATNGVVGIVEAEAEKVAENARREWYGEKGVRMITGESGDIQVVTTIDTGRAMATVSVGSTDKRGGRKPVPVFVHSPGVLSRRLESVTVERWRATPRGQRGPFSLENLPPAVRPKFAGVTFPAIYVVPPNAGKGWGMLLSNLVVKPMREAIAQKMAAIAAATAREAAK